MKKLVLLILSASILLSTILCACQKKSDEQNTVDTTTVDTSVQEDTPKAPKMVTCMSFNILGVEGDSSGFAPGRKRFPKIIELIMQYEPDVICFQEANHKPFDWYQSLTDALTENDLYSVRTFEDETGVTQTTVNGLMIFYKNSCFELLESGGELYANNRNGKRGFHWVKLHDKTQDKDVFVTNTHWSIDKDQSDNPSTLAGDKDRTNQASTLLDFWNSTVKNNILFACGDYNCKKDSKWFLQLSEGIYQDGHIIKDLKMVGNVDHCFINPNVVRLLHYGYITDKFTMDGKEYRYSDHTPVFVRVRY